jgi:hypothetical protein
MTATKYPFVDASFAAELLGVQPADILEWIASGRLKTFGGKDKNPFVRTAEVEALASELGRELGAIVPKRRAADNPVRRVELRIRHDARWTDITAADIEAWRREQDDHSLAAARSVAQTGRERLEQIIAVIDDSKRTS